MSFHLKGTHEVVTKGGGLTCIVSDNTLESCATPSHPAQTNVKIILKSHIARTF